jgi:hypothetical protein
MNDVREVFDRMLSTPAPPMTSSDQVLAAAHRQGSRRRLGFTMAGVAAVAALAIAVPGAISLAGANNGAASAAGGGAPPGRPSASRSPIDAVLTTPLCDENFGDIEAGQLAMMRQVNTTLHASLPATVKRGPGSCEGARDTSVRYVGASSQVFVGNQAGTVTALRYRISGEAPTDLCAVTPAQQIPSDIRPNVVDGTQTSCQVLNVNGSRIRVAAVAQRAPGTDPPVTMYYAVRYISGWMIMVTEVPYLYVPVVPNHPMLTKPVYTMPELAAVAAKPGFAQ